MGNKKKTTTKTKKITLGERAQSFYDAATGIHFSKGEVKELTPRQYGSAKIKKAINTGHLVLANTVDTSAQEEEEAEDNKARFDLMVNQGMEVSKIAKAFTISEATKIAEEYGITPDEGDTVEVILKAVVDDIEGKSAE